MPSPVARLLGDLAAALAAAGVPWYLFGAQAAILYGSARLTADVDATVRLPQHMATAALVHVLESGGFDPRFTDAGFVARTRVLPVVHRATGLPVDLVLAGPGLEELFFERVRTMVVEDITLPVAAPEDLVVMKVLSDRPKDHEDIRAIIEAQGARLDIDQIRSTLHLLEEALSQSDLLPTFERLHSRRSS